MNPPPFEHETDPFLDPRPDHRLRRVPIAGLVFVEGGGTVEEAFADYPGLEPFRNRVPFTDNAFVIDRPFDTPRFGPPGERFLECLNSRLSVRIETLFGLGIAFVEVVKRYEQSDLTYDSHSRNRILRSWAYFLYGKPRERRHDFEERWIASTSRGILRASPNHRPLKNLILRLLSEPRAPRHARTYDRR